MQAFIQYSRQFTQPLSQLGSMANLLQSGVASGERVFELLDETEEEPDDVDAETPPDSSASHLAFEDVAFSYSPDKPLIGGLTLTAKPGQHRRHRRADGRRQDDAREPHHAVLRRAERQHHARRRRHAHMTRDDLRSRTGMVLQDTWLFSGTIRENIAYGRPDATEDEILAAAPPPTSTASCTRFRTGTTPCSTMRRPTSAWASASSSRSHGHSSRTRVLILDEATSSVDTRTELLIQRAMSKLRADRTAFVIAHRLSTIRDADLILVMEDGAIVEQGSHDELLQGKGAYWRLYNAQFEAPIDAEEADRAPVGIGTLASAGAIPAGPASEGGAE